MRIAAEGDLQFSLNEVPIGIPMPAVARDTDSVLTISLIGNCRSKNARRIWPILSTPIIPRSPSRPPQATEGDIDETSEGSRLDAKNPPQGVIIASEFTPVNKPKSTGHTSATTKSAEQGGR